MSKFKLGDKVVVTDDGENYSTYSDWANLHGLSKYTERSAPVEGHSYTVVAVGRHESGSRVLLAIEKDEKQFIIGEEGIELYVEDTRTPAQKAGLVIGQRYKIRENSNSFSAGKVVYFTNDDGTENPYFGDIPHQETYTPYVSHALPYVENNTIITFNKVLTQAQIDAIKTLVGE